MDYQERIPIALIVPAAGLGRRMGKPKDCVLWHGKTFLDWIYLSWETAVSSSPAIVWYLTAVVTAENRQSALHLPKSTYRTWVMVNKEPDKGYFGSIRTALASLWFQTPCRLFTIWPVDHPAVPPQVLKHLFTTIVNTPPDLREKVLVWIPTFENHGGHPVILSRSLAGTILRSDIIWKEGLRSIIHGLHQQSPESIRRVDVSEPAIRWNFNREEDLLVYQPRWSPKGNSS